MTAAACREGTWTAPGSDRTWSYRYWQPAPARALLVVLHGFGEHGGRYAPVAEDLAEQGIAVAVPDLWAHGRSGGRRGDVGDVGACAEECRALVEAVWRPAWPGGYTLFGHSFGGLLAIAWATAHPQGLRGLVAQSPLLDVAFPLPRLKVLAAKFLAGCCPGARLSLNLDAGALSHDPAVAAGYREDPLVHNSMSARTYQMIWRVRDRVLADAASLRVPTLLLCGGEDRIASAAAAQAWFARLGCEKRLAVFPDAYHELHHEPVRGDVVRLVAEWTRR
jgi:alpha-beta hydrolase superfamily lysophospholipase